MRSFYFKNFISAAGLVVLSFLILCASFIGIGSNITMRERKASIENDVLELSKLASAYARDGALDAWEFRITLSSISQTTGHHCFITDVSGTVISCSDMEFNCRHLGVVIDGEVMRELASTGMYSDITTLGGFYAEQNFVAAMPVKSHFGDTIGFVFAGANASETSAVWRSLSDMFFYSSIIIMALALVIGFVASKKQAQPINEMAEAAVKFAHGEFNVRVSGSDRDDEIGTLASSFNNMAESLEQSEKRRSDFLANIAHELKTPMTTISGFADGILDGTIPPEKQPQYLETISSETKRLNRLVRKMLELSTMQAAGTQELRSKSFDANELLAQTLLVFEKKINDKHLDVNAMLPEASLIVLGDPDAINQVIYNLLENAVKFATEGSELGVSLFKQGDKAYISVKNQGDTIPPEELPLIFERFHKTDKSRSMDRDGVGLGLYIVKTILNNHDEDIVVTSRDGVTEFVFSLTLKPAKKLQN